jgi:hypothetical protein
MVTKLAFMQMRNAAKQGAVMILYFITKSNKIMLDDGLCGMVR